ncbi:DNA topoisomerase III [Paenibacillus sambharensis]|uniref:DNA topoisomerase n=1 Tax=Paenibacillus sambharensis TaxID=1803190 RepID=A0A2W1L6E8_9BACL|nr:type IA DNA topoisomerase [Paenibacillus sambharensis]PZD93690.1 DNA topoisomerase III [Paenibacillus sambharensis]
MKTLIIAEKPDMGRTIAAVIEPKAQNRRTYLEGERYIITWAIGHLVSLAEPDQYDARYKRWNADDLPIIPDTFKLWPNPRTKDQLKTIGELAKRCGDMVNACDAGREGQLIFHLIARYLKLRQPVRRLWISDLTPETIRKGFEAMKSDADYEPLTRAAKARSEADWLIGMNASRAFTIRHRALLSVGRVQTPVLSLIYDRYQEITNFKPETYYLLHGHFKSGETAYRGLWQGDRLTDKEKAEALAAKVDGKEGRVASYEVNEQKEYPYRLYDLTLLQREANGKYGFSAKKTLDIAQALYEKHKVISYPRTNSNYVTEENIPVMHKTLQMLQSGTTYGDLARQADQGRVHKGNKAVCNPSKVEDHHAILPTAKKAGNLSADEQKIYDLVVRRFLSHFFPPAVYRHHELLTAVEEETFKTKVKELVELGWKIVLPDAGQEPAKGRGKRKKDDGADEAEDETLILDGGFNLRAGDPVKCRKTEITEKSTQPPKSFTEGTLLKAMEGAGRSIEDDELREAMKDTGLGTPATRASTIERLKQVGYITLAGKKLDITAKGIAAVELIRDAGVEVLTSPEMTGRWEQRLHQISKGEASDEKFMDNVKRFAAMVVEKVSRQLPSSAEVFKEERERRKSGKGSRSSRAAAGTGRNTRAAATPSTTGDGPAAVKPVRAAKESGKKQQTLPACPRTGCGGTLIEGKRGFGCSRYREGCTFVIWKGFEGKTITASMAASLVEKGETRKLSFKRGQTEVKGKLILEDRESGRITTMLDS